jgi:hypothetical protein
MGILALFSVLIVATYIPDQPELTLFDEWVYLDAIDQATDFGVAQRGESVLGETLEVLSCRGVQAYGLMGSPCGGPYISAEYPQGGITGADIHPPTYFVLTAGGAAVIRAMGLSDDLLTSSRMMGAVWLFLGLAGIALLAVQVGATLAAAVGSAGVVASLPLTRYTNSYLTPDNFNLAVGALVMLAALRFSSGRWPWWMLLVAGALGGAAKTQNALAIGAAIVFLAWHLVTNRRSGHLAPRSYALGAAGMLLGFLAVQAIWQLARSLLAVGESPDQGVSQTLTANLLVRETTAFIFRLGQSVTSDSDPTIAYFSAALLVAGCFGALVYRRFDDEKWGVAAATTLLLVVGSPALILIVQFVVGEAIPSPARYGGSLLSPMAAVTAAAFDTRRRGLGLATFGSFAVAIIVADNLLR